MEFIDVVWGFWNGLTAWQLLNRRRPGECDRVNQTRARVHVIELEEDRDRRPSTWCGDDGEAVRWRVGQSEWLLRLVASTNGEES